MRRLQLLILLAASCSSSAPERNAQPKVAITPAPDLCGDRRLTENSFCLDAARIERLMGSDDYLVANVDGPGRGTTDIKVVTYEIADQGQTVRFRAKWKSAAEGGESFNNSPRKELAAYELQKLFLTPDEYVVPPTAIRCVGLHRFQTGYQAPDAKPTFPGAKCVLGLLTYWMEHVTDKDLLRPERLESDAKYKKNISDLNLFTYLIDHRDVHDGNFLISTDPANPRAFSIDNGLAFSGVRNPMPRLKGEPVWSDIIVPSLPKAKVDALRSLDRAKLDTLYTVIQLAPVGDVLVPVDRQPPFDTSQGVRVKEGVVQLGLTKGEIDSIEGRIKELLEKVDQQEIALF